MKSRMTKLLHGFSSLKACIIMLISFVSVLNISAQPMLGARTVTKTFTACALNVDGLPTTIAGISFNPDGPGAEGTRQIGEYVKAKGIDILGLSEDFNYNGDLIEGLAGQYQMGAWQGRIDADGIFNLLHFSTDGLMFLLRNQNYVDNQEMSFSNETCTQWTESKGGLTAGANENIDKGFRFYTVNLGDNVKIDVYILHMNTAEDNAQIAVQDKQLTQLANAILANKDGRPKLVIGDTNCRYTRNKVIDNFISPLSATYDISDVWVEKFRGGVAPTYGSDALVVTDKNSSESYKTGEIVDKIFYLVPKDCSYTMTLKDLVFDADNYKKADGSLLGDHVPVIATFEISGVVPDESYAPAAQPEFWVGETVDVAKSQGEMYIFNVGSGYFITGGKDSQPSVRDVNSAEKWGVANGDKNGTTTFAKGNLRIRMDTNVFGGVGIIEKGRIGATQFTVVESTITEHAYRFDAKYTAWDGDVRHFQINDQGKYAGAEKGLDNTMDWLFISEAQKIAYNNYKAAYDQANALRTDPAFEDMRRDENELFDQLEQILIETTNTNYTTSAEDTQKLIDIYNEIVNRKSIDRNITSVKYGTVCLPWNGWVPEGVKVYTAVSYTDNGDTRYITLAEYTNPQGNANKTVIPANKGFIIFSETADTYTFYKTGKPANAPEANILAGNPNTSSVAQGDLTGCVYALGNKQPHGLGFYNLSASSNIPANCAYLVLGKNDVAQIKRVSFIFNDTPTSVGNAATSADAHVTAVYGVSGEQRASLRRGINIVRMSDGTVRKVAVK